MMLTTTLADIRAASPCSDGWEKLLNHLGKTGAEAKDDTAPLPLETVLDANGLDDALWVFDQCFPAHIRRLYAADCAERVLHLFEAVRPDDDRPRKAIEVARDPDATDEMRAAAWAAARAARDAAWAAEDAAWAAWDAEDAARAAARDAAWAAEAAARDAARDAEDAARAAARDAAWAAEDAAWAAWDAAWAVQANRLRQYCRHGEAAANMEWKQS